MRTAVRRLLARELLDRRGKRAVLNGLKSASGSASKPIIGTSIISGRRKQASAAPNAMSSFAATIASKVSGLAWSACFGNGQTLIASESRRLLKDDLVLGVDRRSPPLVKPAERSIAGDGTDADPVTR